MAKVSIQSGGYSSPGSFMEPVMNLRFFCTYWLAKVNSDSGIPVPSSDWKYRFPSFLAHFAHNYDGFVKLGVSPDGNGGELATGLNN
jgi:hypothetical protein